MVWVPQALAKELPPRSPSKRPPLQNELGEKLIQRRSSQRGVAAWGLPRTSSVSINTTYNPQRSTPPTIPRLRQHLSIMKQNPPMLPSGCRAGARPPGRERRLVSPQGHKHTNDRSDGPCPQRHRHVSPRPVRECSGPWRRVPPRLFVFFFFPLFFFPPQGLWVPWAPRCLRTWPFLRGGFPLETLA